MRTWRRPDPDPATGPSRRRLIGTAAAGGLALTGVGSAVSAGCSPAAPGARAATSPTGAGTASAGTASAGTASVSTVPAGASASADRGAPAAADWRALAGQLHGSVVLPDSASFDAVRHVYNTRFDAVRPAAVVRCADPADVSTALAFVRRFSLPVVPRGGGHSYLGAATVSGGVVVDTGPMADVAFDPGSGTATVGAGARLLDVYRELDRSGYGLAAGSCPSVGIAGQTQGGGQGVVATTHGLTCDAVTALTVVTADGAVREVDARREPELFWALRGGGGGTFGVVTAFRVRPFRTGDCGVWTARWPWAQAARVIAGWQRWTAEPGGGDWGNLHLESAAGTPSLRVSGVSLSGSGTAALDGLTRAVGTDPRDSSHASHSWFDTMLLEAGCSRTGYADCHLRPDGGLEREAFVAGSSVLGAALPDDGIAALVRLVADRASAGRSAAVILDPLTGAVARGSTATSAFPWRGAATSVQWYVSLASTSGAAVREASGFVAGARAALRRWAVGAYVNYPDSSVRDPREYHGATSARLAQVKRRYDPDGLFRTPTAVPA